MRTLLHDLDRVDVFFDDERAVANAGLLLPASLSQRLDIGGVIDDVLWLAGAAGSQPGRKALTLIHSLMAGADCIDDCDMLRAGSSEVVLGHRVMAPSTVGTFLRSFSFGHVRQLDKASRVILERAWQAGAGPGTAPFTIDLDSTICEVYGKSKQAAAYGYTKVLGLHPLVATRADTGEILHSRMRKGSAGSGRGAKRFIDEVVARIRHCGASGKLTLRADSGFWSHKVIDTCRRLDVDYSITIAQNVKVKAAIEAIADTEWRPIAYPETGVADVAETTYNGDRLVVRRTQLADPAQQALWPDWRYHAFITNRPGTAIDLDTDHRKHAVVELAIRDLKEGSGMNHCPSGDFGANSAWLAFAVLAHNLTRWVNQIGFGTATAVVTKTVRRRHITIGGRLTRRSRRYQLHMPSNWPWAAQFVEALTRIRGVQLIC